MTWVGGDLCRELLPGSPPPRPSTEWRGDMSSEAKKPQRTHAEDPLPRGRGEIRLGDGRGGCDRCPRPSHPRLRRLRSRGGERRPREEGLDGRVGGGHGFGGAFGVPIARTCAWGPPASPCPPLLLTPGTRGAEQPRGMAGGGGGVYSASAVRWNHLTVIRRTRVPVVVMHGRSSGHPWTIA